jgi:hypothetical protein
VFLVACSWSECRGGGGGGGGGASIVLMVVVVVVVVVNVLIVELADGLVGIGKQKRVIIGGVGGG